MPITPQQQAQIIAGTAQGATTRDMEPVVGLDHSTIARHQHQLRPLIDAEINALLTEGLTAARQTVVHLAKQGRTADKPEWAKIGLDASKTILNAGGLIGQPSTIINQLVQINTNEVPDTIKALFSALSNREATGSLLTGNKDEVIDV